MKYYRITAYTPFVGEENDFYLSLPTENEEKLRAFVDECIADNVAEWMDEDALAQYYDGDEEMYYEDCGARVKEISLEEFRSETENL